MDVYKRGLNMSIENFNFINFQLLSLEVRHRAGSSLIESRAGQATAIDLSYNRSNGFLQFLLRICQE